MRTVCRFLVTERNLAHPRESAHGVYYIGRGLERLGIVRCESGAHCVGDPEKLIAGNNLRIGEKGFPF